VLLRRELVQNIPRENEVKARLWVEVEKLHQGFALALVALWHSSQGSKTAVEIRNGELAAIIGKKLEIRRPCAAEVEDPQGRALLLRKQRAEPRAPLSGF